MGQIVSALGLIRACVPFLRGVRLRIFAVALVRLCNTACSALLLWVVKGIVDDVYTRREFSRLPVYLAQYVALVGAKIVLDYAYARLDQAVSERITQNARSDVYRALLSAPPARVRRIGIGQILTSLSGDAASIEYLVYSGPLSVASNAVATAVFLCVLLVLSPALTLCTLIFAPLIALAGLRAAPRVRRAARSSRRWTGGWMTVAEERLQGLQVIQAFTAEDEEHRRLHRLFNRARQATLRSGTIRATVGAINEVVACVGGLVILSVGAMEIQRGSLSVGGLIAYIGSMGSLYSPIRGLFRQQGRYQRSAVRIERIVALLGLQPMRSGSIAANPESRGAALELRNLSFSYPGGKEVLRDINLRVGAGEKLAIVGASGSGKSTLGLLLLRFYDPDSGEILLDGRDIRTLTLSSLRKSICVVFQDPSLFRESIRQTVRFGNPRADEGEIASALSISRAQGFISAISGGLSARLGARGTGLSTGQQQRIALARGVLRNSPILFLDEATSAVDSETEDRIQVELRRRRPEQTLIIVSHRLSSVRNADRIVVLQDGRIVETGTPDWLLGSSSRCRELFAAQMAV